MITHTLYIYTHIYAANMLLCSSSVHFLRLGIRLSLSDDPTPFFNDQLVASLVIGCGPD